MDVIDWKASPKRSEEVGMIMAGHNVVTHCYERPTFPDWPYTHFTMVHATTPEGCRETAEAACISERLALDWSREYKKTRAALLRAGLRRVVQRGSGGSWQSRHCGLNPRCGSLNQGFQDGRINRKGNPGS